MTQAFFVLICFSGERNRDLICEHYKCQADIWVPVTQWEVTNCVQSDLLHCREHGAM